MARSLGGCYYTGRTGLKCEHCPLSEQQYCGNYTTINPLAGTRLDQDVPGRRKLIDMVKEVLRSDYHIPKRRR